MGTTNTNTVTIKPIARWARVEWETVHGTEYVGVVAYHKNGIKEVRYTIYRNGDNDAISQEVVTESRLNPKTEIEEYSFNFNFSDLGQGGYIEVAAEVEATDGSITILSDPWSVDNMDMGLHSIHLQNRWHSSITWQVAIAPKGNDNNDGIYEPFETYTKAISVANYGDTILFGTGEFEVRQPSSVPTPAAGTGNWIILKGAGQDNTILYSNGSFRTNGKCKFENLMVDLGRSGYTTKGRDLWWHNCKFYSPSSEAWFADGVAKHGFPDPLIPIAAKGNANSWFRNGGSVTDCVFDLYSTGFGSCSPIRNCTITRIWGDAFSQGNGIFNVDIDGFYGYLSEEHSDIYQMWNSKENVIMYNVNATNVESVQGIFCRPISSPQPTVPFDPAIHEQWYVANTAFVNNTIIHVPDPNPVLNLLNAGGPPYSQIGGKNIHVLFINHKLPYQKIFFNGDASGWEMRNKEDVILTNCDLHWGTIADMHSTSIHAKWHPIPGVPDAYEYDGVRAYGCFNSVPMS